MDQARKSFPDTEDAWTLAKLLKKESKTLKKNAEHKKVLEVMQCIVRLEQELRGEQARGESIEVTDSKDADEPQSDDDRKDEKKEGKDEVSKFLA